VPGLRNQFQKKKKRKNKIKEKSALRITRVLPSAAEREASH
jgi:hypothetical protein